MDDWEKFNEKSLPEKEDFEIKNLWYCHQLYVQSDTLLLADVFDNFRNMCLKIYGLGPAKFLSTPEWQAPLKRMHGKQL